MKGSSRLIDGHAARRRFGQNFLVDPAIIDAICHEVAPQPGDQMVEIGPGLGALTEVLLSRLERLTVIEIDRDLAARLRNRFQAGQLDVRQADALSIDWSTLFAGGPMRVVGNLPYNISSPLLVMLIRHRHRIHDQHFMLQREVVDRIVAGPGPDNGRLGLLLQAFYHCERVLEVPPEAFRPAPRVHSAVVRMTVREQALVPDADLFSEVLAVAFTRRRKMIRTTLIPWLAARRVDLPDLDGRLRPEDMSAAQWHEIASNLYRQRLAADHRSTEQNGREP